MEEEGVIAETDYLGFEDERELQALAREFGEVVEGNRREMLVYLLKKKVHKEQWTALKQAALERDWGDQVEELNERVQGLQAENDRLRADNIQLDGMCQRLQVEAQAAKEAVEPLRKRAKVLEKKNTKVRHLLLAFGYVRSGLKQALDESDVCVSLIEDIGSGE